MESTQPRYYLVRTRPELVKKGIIGIGWSRVNFSEHLTGNDLIRSIQAIYKIPRSKPAILRFFGMKKGDIIVVPLVKSIAIGVIDDDKLTYSEYDKANDRSNQRSVKFYIKDDKKLFTIGSESLNHAFQKSIKVPGGVVKDIYKFRNQIDNVIEFITLGKPLNKETWVQENSQSKKEFAANLLKQLNNGKTYLRAGGIGLEQLVKELFTIEGYRAKVLGKRKFKGCADADIEATRTDTSESIRFTKSKLLIQVKHHQGSTGTWGVKQLELINKNHDNYLDHQLFLITSAKVNADLRNRADAANIKIIEGEELTSWIFDHLNKLSSKMKTALGIEVVTEKLPQQQIHQ